METNKILFPEKLHNKLMSLETQKMSLIEGFLYSLDIQGNFSICSDLSGIEKVNAPPAPKVIVNRPPNSDGPGPLI